MILVPACNLGLMPTQGTAYPLFFPKLSALVKTYRLG